MEGRAEKFRAFDVLAMAFALLAAIIFTTRGHLLPEWLLFASSLSLVSTGALLMPGGLWGALVAGGLALLGASLSPLDIWLVLLLLVISAGLVALCFLIFDKVDEGRRTAISLALFSVIAILALMLAREAAGRAVSPLGRTFLGGLPLALPTALVVLLTAHPLVRRGQGGVWPTVFGAVLALLGGFSLGRRVDDLIWPLFWLMAPLAVLLVGGITSGWERRHLLRVVAGATIVGALLAWFESLGFVSLGLLAVAVLAVLGALADPMKGATLGEIREALLASPLRVVGGALYSVAMLGLLWGGAMVAMARVPRYKGMIVATAGDIFVRFRGSKEWGSVPWGTLLSEGDELRTGTASAAIIKFGDGSVVKASSGTELEIHSFREEEGVFERRIKLRIGRLWVRAKEGLRGFFDVEAPVAVAGVRGTDFSVAALPDQAYVSCWSGIVSVTSAGWTVVVRAMQETKVRRGERPEKPKPMSPEEITRWRREIPSLEAPAPESLWERQLQGRLLSDNFDDNRIDLGTWMMISLDPAVSVKEEGGELRIVGVRSLRGELLEAGLSSHPFIQTSIEASAKVRFVRGHGRAEVRLCGERNSVGFGFHSGKGYLLVTYGKWPDIVAIAPPVGDEDITPRTVSLLYDSLTKRVRAYLDGAFIGSSRVDLGERVRVALLYVTRRLDDRIDCTFDDFSSNVVVGAALPVALAVGAIWESPQDQTPSRLCLLRPLSPRAAELVRRVELKRPKVMAGPSPLFAKAAESVRMRRRADFWAVVEEEAGLPQQGDYFFRFTIGTGVGTVRWLSVKEASIAPPRIVHLRKKEDSLYLAWSSEGAMAFWVDLFEVKKNKLLARERLRATERSAFLYPALFGGEKVMAVVRAFSKAVPPESETLVDQTLAGIDALVSPGGVYWVALAASGIELEAACAKTSVMTW